MRAIYTPYMKPTTWTYRLLFAIVSMVLLNTLTVYEVSKWAVVSHHAKVWIDKKEENNTLKKLLFLDNKVLTDTQKSHVKNPSLSFKVFLNRNSVYCFLFSKKNSFFLFSFSHTQKVFTQNQYVGVIWKMFFGCCINTNAP